MCFPIQLQVAREIVNKHPKVKVLVMVASTIEKDFIQSFLQSNHFPIIVLKDDPAKMIRLAHAVLATSGTATLFVGLLEKPMVIMYRFKFFSGLIAKHFVKGIKFFGLVNLLLDREVVPERWQAGAEAKNLVPLVERSLFDEDYKRQVVSDLKLLPQHLGEPGALNRLRLLLEAEMK
jgi:lipid-A-disaccharide synthase